MAKEIKSKESVHSVQKTDKKKSDFLVALKNNNGNISDACIAVNIGKPLAPVGNSYFFP